MHDHQHRSHLVQWNRLTLSPRLVQCFCKATLDSPSAASLSCWLAGTEHTVDDGVGSTVQRCKTLDQGCHCDVALCARNVAVDLQEVEHNVRAPTQYKN